MTFLIGFLSGALTMAIGIVIGYAFATYGFYRLLANSGYRVKDGKIEKISQDELFDREYQEYCKIVLKNSNEQ